MRLRRCMSGFWAVAFGGLVLLPAVAWSQAPARLGYQGRLLKANGTPEAGVVKVTFSLFDADKGGSALWTEDQNVAFTEGFYSTFLGEVTPLSPSIFAGKDRYLELSVGGAALAPRQRVGSVAYALSATDARNLLGGTVDASSIKVGGKTVFDATGQLAAAAGTAFLEKTALASSGTVNDAGNPVDWTRLKNVPSAVLTEGLSTVAHDGSLAGEGSAAKPLKVMFGATAETVAPGNHTHADYALSADLSGFRKLLSNPGTLNGAANPVDWTALKNVPLGFADGTDDGLGAVAVLTPLNGNGTASSPIALGRASAAASGFLSSTDWARFDLKLEAVSSRAPFIGHGTPASPLSLPTATSAIDGYLSAPDWSRFEGKLSSVFVSAPLTGQGTAASPVTIGPSSGQADGFLRKGDYLKFDAKVDSVLAGPGLARVGTAASPMLQVDYKTVQSPLLPASGATLPELCPAGEHLDGIEAGTGKAICSGVAVSAPLTGSGTALKPLTLGAASATADGYLSKGDFAAFNGKLGVVTASGPLTGSGTASSPLAIGAASATADGYLSKGDFAAFSGKSGSVIASGPITGSGTASSPLAIGAASATADGYLSKGDFAAFNGKLGSVVASGPLGGAGTSGSPLAIAKASSTSDGFLSSADFGAFTAKVSSVGAGTGVSIGGTASAPSVGVVYGATAGTAAQGNDARLSDARAPSAGSASYVQNQTAAPQTAGFNVAGNALVGGNVGIKTATPTFPLDVSGEVRINGLASAGVSNGLRFASDIGGGGGDLARIFVQVDATGTERTSLVLRNDNDGPGGVEDNIRLQAANIFVESNGSAGGGQLMVNGNLLVDNTSVARPAARVIGENQSTGDPNTYLFVRDVTGGVDWGLKSANDGTFAIHHSGVGDRLNIDLAGNVGIGTATPNARLEVAGDAILSGKLNGNLVPRAYGASAWSQSGLVSYTAASVNDGNWATAAFHTDSSPVGAYLKLDLGTGNARAFRRLVLMVGQNFPQAIWEVQHSDDASAWTTALAGLDTSKVQANSSDISSGEWRWDNASAHRYWRLYKTNPAAGGGYHFEVQFYEDPAPRFTSLQKLAVGYASPGSSTFSVNGNVGIGTVTPAAMLDVRGAVRVGATAATCDASLEGAQRYAPTLKRMEFCNGSAWLPFSSVARSCKGYAGLTSGYYTIQPGPTAFSVYCDLTAPDGPWTLIARIKRSDNQAHFSTGAVGGEPVLFGGGSTQKLSDARVAEIRATADYAGSTDIKFTCFEGGSSELGCSAATMYCSSTCSFDATASCGGGPCSLCSQSYEGTLTQLTPNTGTRGLGHHHLSSSWFAFQRHPEQGNNSGCRSDSCGGGDGHLWVK